MNWSFFLFFFSDSQTSSTWIPPNTKTQTENDKFIEPIQIVMSFPFNTDRLHILNCCNILDFFFLNLFIFQFLKCSGKLNAFVGIERFPEKLNVFFSHPIFIFSIFFCVKLSETPEIHKKTSTWFQWTVAILEAKIPQTKNGCVSQRWLEFQVIESKLKRCLICDSGLECVLFKPTVQPQLITPTDW